MTKERTEHYVHQLDKIDGPKYDPIITISSQFIAISNVLGNYLVINRKTNNNDIELYSENLLPYSNNAHNFADNFFPFIFTSDQYMYLIDPINNTLKKFDDGKEVVINLTDFNKYLSKCSKKGRCSIFNTRVMDSFVIFKMDNYTNDIVIINTEDGKFSVFKNYSNPMIKKTDKGSFLLLNKKTMLGKLMLKMINLNTGEQYSKEFPDIIKMKWENKLPLILSGNLGNLAKEEELYLSTWDWHLKPKKSVKLVGSFKRNKVFNTTYHLNGELDYWMIGDVLVTAQPKAGARGERVMDIYAKNPEENAKQEFLYLGPMVTQEIHPAPIVFKKQIRYAKGMFIGQKQIPIALPELRKAHPELWKHLQDLTEPRLVSLDFAYKTADTTKHTEEKGEGKE